MQAKNKRMYSRSTKRFVFLMLFTMCSALSFSQNIGIRTNLAHWATIGSPNLGAEFALNRNFSLEIAGGFNLWELGDNRKAKHWLVQPEIRYWFCETFNGHFVGLHAIGGEFNIGGVDIPIGRLSRFREYRYEGFAVGGGISYGYQWIIGRRWNLELNLGLGYARLFFDQFPCARCADLIRSGRTNYFGITKAAISFIYFIN